MVQISEKVIVDDAKEEEVVMVMVNTMQSILTSVTAKQVCDPTSEFFKSTYSYHTPPPNPISIDSKATVRQGCLTLAENKISSAPIRNAATNTFDGQLDSSDLVAHILDILNSTPIDVEASKFTLYDILSQRSEANSTVTSIARKKLIAVQASVPLLVSVALLTTIRIL